ILIVRLQSGKGGGLAAEVGGASSSPDSIVGGRQAATMLTRASWISGGLFLVLALLVGILSSRSTTAPSSILRSEFQAPTGTPASVLDSESGLSTPVPLDGSDATSADTPAEEPAGDESVD
ncbi:MAG: preprotein translocase subunit SecG, partial [Actinobacteria bacterium]